VAAPVLSRGKYAALFAAESRDQLGRAARAAAGLRAGGPPALLDEAFRAVHTIKGMAAAMGYAASETAADAAEHRLGALRAAAAPVAAADADAVVALVDSLEAAVDADTADPAAPPPHEAPAGPSRGGAPPEWEPGAPRGAQHVQPVRVDAARLDALLDLAGELAAARGRLAAAAAHAPDPALARAVQDVTRVAQALQAAVVEARLVPLAELFDRLPRVTREAARAAGREVAFEAAGGDAAVDRGVLDALGEPLTHLLRNAVDHGVEPPAVRVAAGKPAAGRVRVAAERVPGGVIVTVEDDGRGVDRAAVLAAARRRGAGAACARPRRRGLAADQLDDAALLDLLARPGLTTAAAGHPRVGPRRGRRRGTRPRARPRRHAHARHARGAGDALHPPRPAHPRGHAGAPRARRRPALRPPLAHVRATREPAAGDRPVPLTRLLGVAGRKMTPSRATSSSSTRRVARRSPPASTASRARPTAWSKRSRACAARSGPPRTATILDAGEVALVLDVPALVARSLAPAPR
jgi:chemotaxis protein histidine kinase CheA